MYGYQGKILRVNLTDRTIKTEPLDFETAVKYVGGRGLGTKYMLDEVDPTVDPLSPENKLMIVTGPLTGTPNPTGGRYMVVTKGPLTGTIASSNSGGRWGAELKFAGYDMIIFEGKADQPVYLAIEDDKVEIRDAAHLWGKEVSPTEAILAQETPERSKFLSIGPAGERLSLMACIMNDTHRAAGRTGVGAVMGSKNLKAIAVRGTNKVPLADEAGLKELNQHLLKLIKENGVTGEGLPAYGTAILVNVINELGVLPTNNFQEAKFAEADQISGEHMTEHYLTRKDPCFRCPIGCGRYVSFDGKEGGGPEYETIWAFGSDCGVTDFKDIMDVNFVCNEVGIDTITAGATIAAGMELYQRGLISEADLDGVPLQFGDGKGMVEWTRRMGYREGLGDLMADGSYRLGEHFGVPEISMSVKKQELPAYDPRALQGQALAYATSNRGGCHVRAYLISPEVLGLPEPLDRFSVEGKATWVKIFQDLTAWIDSSGLCLFTSFALGVNEYAAMFDKVVGGNYTAEDVLTAGERIYNLERLFNLKAGIDPSQDTLPKRLLHDPIPEGPSKGEVARLDELLPEYYAVRGWDQGVPNQAKQEELGLV